MIELGSRRISSLDGAVLIRGVPGLKRGNSPGYLQYWTAGGSRMYSGINGGIHVEGEVDDMRYAGFAAAAHGLPLGNRGFFGMVRQEFMYDEASYLCSGVIVTRSERREFFGRDMPKWNEKPDSNYPQMRVSESMPEYMISIIGQTPEDIITVGELLRLPVDSLRAD